MSNLMKMVKKGQINSIQDELTKDYDPNE